MNTGEVMARKINGLEMQLLMLSDLQATSQFVGEELHACAECYQTLELCLCTPPLKPLVWPVENVIEKLRITIKRYQAG